MFDDDVCLSGKNAIFSERIGTGFIPSRRQCSRGVPKRVPKITSTYRTQAHFPGPLKKSIFSEDLINELCRRHQNCLGSRDAGSRTLQGPPKHRRWNVPESPMIPLRQFRPSKAPFRPKPTISIFPSEGSRMTGMRGVWKYEMYQTL